MKFPTTWLIVLIAVSVAAPAAAQGGGALGSADDFSASIRLLDDDLRPLGSDARDRSLLDTPGRLGLGPLDLGINVSPRKRPLDLALESNTLSSAAVRYRIADTELRTTDIGVDLRIRWPGIASEPAVSAIEPYVSLGALALTQAEPSPLAATTTRSDVTMSVGMRGALGLTWHLSPDASFFGEYRMSQDRTLRQRTGTEAGVDLFYGFSLRF